MRHVAGLLVGALVLGGAPCADAQPGSNTVRIDVPSVVLIQIVDLSVTSYSAPSRVSFNQAFLLPGQALRISVKADNDLILPGGGTVPAPLIAWTTSQVSNGVGMNGSLSTGLYSPVYESHAGARSGRVDLTWGVSLPPGIARAGTAQMTIRWKLEAVTP